MFFLLFLVRKHYHIAWEKQQGKTLKENMINTSVLFWRDSEWF